MYVWDLLSFSILFTVWVYSLFIDILHWIYKSRIIHSIEILSLLCRSSVKRSDLKWHFYLFSLSLSRFHPHLDVSSMIILIFIILSIVIVIMTSILSVRTLLRWFPSIKSSNCIAEYMMTHFFMNCMEIHIVV